MTTGEKIRILRHKKGLTQEQLAAIVGCGKSYISHIENNRDVPFDWIDKIATVLDTTGPFLMNWAVDPDKKMFLFRHIDELKDEQFEQLLALFLKLRAENTNKS